MTLKERIREHILSLRDDGVLEPGEIIPSFHELRRKFDTSYATVQGAVESLERDGVVFRKRGFGTVLSGIKPLEIDLLLNVSSFPQAETEALLAEFCESQKLYLDIKIKNRTSASLRNSPLSGKKAAIYEAKFFDRPLYGSLLDYSSFPDCEPLFGQMKSLPIPSRNIFLPFALFPAQMAFNRQLMKSHGISMANPEMDFAWWDSYAGLCRGHGVQPAVKRWPFHALWQIEKFLPLLFALRLNETKDPDAIRKLPIFATRSGEKFLRILKSFSTYRTFGGETPSFEKGQAAFSSVIGSWISVQHEKRFGMPSESFEIAPYHMDGRKICSFELSGLMTFAAPDISPDEKRRVWELLKILLSREFQIRLAGLSGMVSVRKDVAPEDHPWNTRPDYAAFFPEENDISIYNNVFDTQVVAALSALFEQFEAYGAELEHILKDMDEKVRSIHEPT